MPGFRAGCVTPESACSLSFARGAGGRASLFLHQAVHASLACGAGICPRDRSRSSVDRRAGSLDVRILLLTAAVTFWVGGFDVIYACQDIDFDRQNSLNSIPQAYGVSRALLLARALHLLMLGLLVTLVPVFGLGKIAFAGVAAVALLLLYEHSLVSARDLSKLNAAFFTMNGVIAVVFFAFVAADLLIHTRH